MSVPAASNAFIEPKVQGANNGDALVVRSGGSVVIEPGAALWMAGSQFNAVAGQHTTAAAVDTVVTKSWKGGGSPVAGTTFSKKVNWSATGT
jgi:hypothetical protein